MESPPSPNSKSLDADLDCMRLHFSCFIFGLRIIYVGAFAFELRIFLERGHFAIDADILSS